MEIDQGDIGQRLCFDASVFFAPAADSSTADDDAAASSSAAAAVAAFDVDAFLARHATAAPTLHALHADLRAFDQRLDARYGTGKRPRLVWGGFVSVSVSVSSFCSIICAYVSLSLI
jgi:hypothetical protein